MTGIATVPKSGEPKTKSGERKTKSGERMTISAAWAGKPGKTFGARGRTSNASCATPESSFIGKCGTPTATFTTNSTASRLYQPRGYPPSANLRLQPCKTRYSIRFVEILPRSQHDPET
jgi:hypothetical protein